MLTPQALAACWVPNRGAACTTASILAGLRALGARGLPELGEACRRLGASVPYGAPALLDYVALPGRPTPLDRRVERLAAEHGLRVRSRTSPWMPWRRLRPGAEEVLVANLAWGQERPGVYGTWGWHPMRPSTYATGGHSVVVVAADAQGWLVLDPNHPGLQRWPRPGLAVTVTRIRPLPASPLLTSDARP
ncbi:MAG TPA: hypothetical protein VKY90_00340 [Candidatus Dormibacteraeota bacterium]|nr:hypothetical protein [Candidatus Dormibacteraeota bacterium]